MVGHVEWITFLRVDRPPVQGDISLADAWWDEAAGGGGVAAVELARLAGRCRLITAVGDDAVGQGLAAALAAHGVSVEGCTRPGPHRRGVTLLDPQGERTIVVQGPAQMALGDDGIEVGVADVLYFCKGDAAMLREARRARVLVATARMLPTLREAGVRVDALVRSHRDRSERYQRGDLDPEPWLVASTEGADGGSYTTADGQTGRWAAAALPGPRQDTYGAGDCFAAALAFALGEGRPIPAALSFAASRGAAAVARTGAHGGPPATARLAR